jgi:cell wall-associated NlpC family hydrolase
MSYITKIIFILIVFFLLTIKPYCNEQQEVKYLIVTDIVANIRAKPVDATTSYIKDDLQETQVLFNEGIICKDEIEDWFFVECIEQQEFNHNNKWEGYPGWIKKSQVKIVKSLPKYNLVIKKLSTNIYSSPNKDSKTIISLPLGVRLEFVSETTDYYKIVLPISPFYGWIKKSDVNNISDILPPQKIRENIIQTATQLLGTPYLWGGRSPLIPSLQHKIVTGVDCSGFTSLVYRANNIIIPRDAHEQWMYSKPITEISELKPADLIFISKKQNLQNIGHVMMYVSGELFIESDTTTNASFVKYRTFKQKFGYSLEELKKLNFEVDDRKIYFGRIPQIE